MRDGRDGDGVDGQGSNTPRTGVSFVKVVRYTQMAPGFLTVPFLQKIFQSHRNVLQIYQFHLFQLLWMKVLQSFWTATNNGNQVAQVKDLKGNKQKWLVAKQDRLMWEQENLLTSSWARPTKGVTMSLCSLKGTLGCGTSGGVLVGWWRGRRRWLSRLRWTQGGREMGTGGTSLWLIPGSPRNHPLVKLGRFGWNGRFSLLATLWHQFLMEILFSIRSAGVA